jgi:SAM-dependent methyltransferase
MNVIWHDIECGSYDADMALWRSLAENHDGPVLDVGAGTGRITVDLARHGHQVVALDRDPTLIDELSGRAAGLPVETVVADARSFELRRRFGLIVVPMQTIQLLGGADGRKRFLESARAHLDDRGVVAIAISEELDIYEADGGPGAPLPDIRELAGVVYCSQPTAVRQDREGFLLERRREIITGQGTRTVEQNVIRIDGLTADELEREGRAVDLHTAGRLLVEPTADHVGSVVVILGG